MSAPGYAWTCPSCRQENGAERENCLACGLPAQFTARQLAQMKPDNTSDEKARDGQGLASLFLFIPEGPIALVCVACAPVWACELVAHGRIIAASVLMLATAGVGAAMYFAIMRKQKWLAYVAILAYLVCVFCTNGQSG